MILRAIAKEAARIIAHAPRPTITTVVGPATVTVALPAPAPERACPCQPGAPTVEKCIRHGALKVGRAAK